MTLIYKEMRFIEYGGGEVLFLNPEGEERYFGYPCDNSCNWAREIESKVSEMKLGKIYDFQAVGDFIIDVVGENFRYEKLKSEDERKIYLKNKMSEDRLSEEELAEAIKLGVKTSYKNHSWGLVALVGAFAMYAFDFSVGLIIVAGLTLFKIMMENLKK